MAKTGGIAANHLRSFIERIERLETDKAALAADIREVYAEAKAGGFEPKVMRKVIAMRKKDADDLAAEQATLDLYTRALGMAREAAE
ncbi:MAG: DUF2312 domain-containing protein [Alphaproteobacteria bacterium]